MNQCECEYESIHIQEYESDQIHIFFMNLITTLPLQHFYFEERNLSRIKALLFA